MSDHGASEDMPGSSAPLSDRLLRQIVAEDFSGSTEVHVPSSRVSCYCGRWARREPRVKRADGWRSWVLFSRLDVVGSALAQAPASLRR